MIDIHKLNPQMEERGNQNNQCKVNQHKMH